jgi:hypothetical protein
MATTTHHRPAAVQRQQWRAAEALFHPVAAAPATGRMRVVPAGAGDRTGGCPACGSPLPIAPVRSRHRTARAIEHDWHCAACDHHWTTTATVSVAASGPRFPVGSLVKLVIPYGSRRPPAAPFEVVAMRPSENGGMQYRIRSPDESFERIAGESELEPVPGRGD